MFVFLILAVVMITGAVGVITLKQPVHAALSLVATLLTLAVTYVTLEAHFLATIQVIVYAGAIMVLFLFVIMLLNVQEDKEEAGLAWIRPAAYGIGLAAAFGIAITAFRNPSQIPDVAVVSAALQGGGAGPIADALFSEFVLPFQLVGVLLLTGIVGATSLVQRKAVAVYGSPEEKLKVPTVTATTGSVAVLERDPAPEAKEVQAENKQEPKEAEETDSTVDEATLLKELEQAEKAQKISEAKAEKAETSPEPDGSSSLREDVKADSSEASVIEKDDLKRISGVGPVLEELLNNSGVYTFKQIATFTKEDIEALDEKLEGFHGRIERDDWVSQAKELAAEKE